ncbi:MAG TPA: hypothetical protein VNX18_11555 [Bryobacteraceae bacterium]|nr:hypothetical protein [Bryobacteraceae bacterium]
MAATLFAQRTMTVSQVTGFIKSSVQQKLDDRQVAEVLKKTKLTEKLDPAAIAELQALGAGPRTMAALRELADASTSLPAPAPPPPKQPRLSITTAPDNVVQAKILDGIREYATNYTQNLPNFICTQVTRRQVDPSGTGDHFQSVDKIQEQLTYFDHRENYKVVMVNGQMVQNKEHEKLGGAVTSGEFGSIMAEIFEPDTSAEFDWDHLGKWDGRVVNVFHYRVRQPLSHYTIEHVPSSRKITAGYHGLIYANRDTSAILHITLECEEIPKDFPIQDIKTNLSYDVAKISDQEFILPLKWEMHSRDGKYLVWNSAEYALYRKFETTSTLTFDTPDPVPESKTKEEPVAPPVKKKP